MLYPIFFTVMQTFVILLFTLRIRLTSVRRVALSLSYYSMFQGDEIPDLVIKTSRNVANLFEVPSLFYTAGVLYIALEMSDSVPVTLAWLFVIARLIHTGIHLSYNNVMHRLTLFVLGNLSVLGMWISIVSSANAA